jgi:etoposide-induced 2.4 mRNA
MVFGISFILFHSIIVPSMTFLAMKMKMAVSMEVAVAKVLFNVLWMYPMHVFAFLVNSLWYQDIANEAFAIMNKAAPAPVALHTPSVTETLRQIMDIPGTLVTRLARELYRFVILSNFMVVLAILENVILPFPLNMALGLVGWTSLNAFFIFEYRWSHAGVVSLERKIDILESHWSYFLAFGTSK